MVLGHELKRIESPKLEGKKEGKEKERKQASKQERKGINLQKFRGKLFAWKKCHQKNRQITNW